MKRAVREFTYLSGVFVEADAVPLKLHKWVDFQGHVRAMKKTANDIDSVLHVWLQQHLHKPTSSEPLDCRSIMYDIVSPIIRPNPSLTHATSSTRDSFIPLWDDCINRIISKFCPLEIIITRKPTSTTSSNSNSSDSLLQDQWPNVTGFVRNYCLWRD